MKPTDLRMVLFRDSFDEQTCAIIDAVVDFDTAGHPTSTNTFMALLRNACTAWYNETPEGKEAYDESDADFNIGDLANETPQTTDWLLWHMPGVLSFEIAVYSVENIDETQYSFDSHLIKINDEEEDENETRV